MSADPLKSLRAAARRRDRADKTRREATDDLRRYAREAKAQGVSMTRIADQAGLSRQGLYDLLAERPSQAPRQTRA